MNQRGKKQNLTRPITLPGLPPSGSTGSALKTGRPFCTWLLAFLLAGLAAPSLAQDAPQSFAIPAQALGDALTEFADQADLKLVSDAALLRGLSSPGVSGTLTPAQGLERLLAGTGMRYRFVDTGTVTIERAPKASPQPEPLAQATPPPKPEATVLPEMTVTARPTDATSYTVPNASTATKTDTPIMETPVSVQVVPQQVLRDQQAFRLQDAVENVSGVQVLNSSGNEFDGFRIRGFGGNRFRNGVRNEATGKSDLANIEQVEVLKGPAAVLYGRLEPGGIINLVTKKPLAEPYYSLEQEFGSYDFYRTTADATGPLNADRTLLYRFNLGYLDSDSFRDFLFRDNILVVPALTPREDTELNLNLEYRNEDLLVDSGIPTSFASGNNRIAPVPISRQYTEPGVNDEIETYLVDFNWSHRFNAHWTLRNGFVGQFDNDDFREVSGGFVLDDEHTVDRFREFSFQDRDQYSVFADLTGDFQLLGMAHKVLLGADYYEENVEGDAFSDLAGLFSFPIDLFNPVYGQVDLAALQSQPLDRFFRVNQSWYGLYFQDQITLWDRVHILGGGRYDWAETRQGFASTAAEAEMRRQRNEIAEEAFSPRVGLVYQPWPWLSLYGNYVESFGANNGRSASGAPFEAQRGEQYEVGLKTEWWDGRLSSTLAFYHLTKTNLLTADLSTLDRFDSIAIGEARSRGIELDLSGRVTERLSLIASYAYTDTEITKDPGQDELGNPTPGNQGKVLPGALRGGGGSVSGRRTAV